MGDKIRTILSADYVVPVVVNGRRGFLTADSVLVFRQLIQEDRWGEMIPVIFEDGNVRETTVRDITEL